MAETSRVHHPFGGSKLQYLQASPLFEGQNSDTDASQAGTRQHNVLEDDCINLDDPTLMDNEAEAVMRCKNYRDGLVHKYYSGEISLLPCLGDLSNSEFYIVGAPGVHVLKEAYLPIDDEQITVGEGDKTTIWVGTSAGYLDFAVLSSDQTEADLCDWKFGLWSVEPAETNLQGISYALGLFHRYPTLKKVIVHFVMPHREEIDVATFTREQVDTLYLRVKTVVARAIEARKAKDWGKCAVRVNPCIWCANLGKCELAARFALQIGHKYAPVEVPVNVIPSLINDPASSTQVMGIAQLMEAWAKAIRKQITEYSLDNKDWLPEGYVMRARQNNVIKDWKKLQTEALAVGLTQEQIDEALTIRLTPLEKYIMANSPRGEKKSELKAFMDRMISLGILEKDNPSYFLERLKT